MSKAIPFLRPSGGLGFCRVCPALSGPYGLGWQAISSAPREAARAKGSEFAIRSTTLRSFGVHPAVREGIELKCWEDRVAVGVGEARAGDRTWPGTGGSVYVPPADVTEIEALPIRLKAGKVQKWRGGNRLVIHRDDKRNLLPDSYVPGSLELRDAEDVSKRFTTPRDFVVDDKWAAFAISDAGRLKPGQHVMARYRLSRRRIDALVLDASGKPTLIRGTPSPDCPEPPVIR